MFGLFSLGNFYLYSSSHLQLWLHLVHFFHCLLLYSSGKFRDSNGIVGLPHQVALGSGPPAQLRGQNCYVEVTLGSQEKMVRNNANLHSNFSQPHGTESTTTRLSSQRWPLDKLPVCEKTFVYPTEAVLVPVMQTSFARSSLKR